MVAFQFRIKRAQGFKTATNSSAQKGQPSLHAFWIAATVLVALGLSAHASILVVCFPVFCLFGGILLLRLSSGYFTEFLVWLWILSPLVRRLVEYRAQGSDGSLILTGPYLACFVPLYFMLPPISKRLHFRLGPLALPLGAVTYGLMVGTFHYPPATVFKNFLLWFGPLTFAIFIYSNPSLFKEIYNAFRKSMVLGTLVASIYGIYQFFFLPGWDSSWMLGLGNDTFGEAAAMKVRSFSTMNSPQILALFLTVGILLSLYGRSSLRYFVVPVAIFATSLTMARTAWVSLGIGGLYLFYKARPRLKLQILAISFGSATLLFTTLDNSQIMKTFSKRFGSLTHFQQDDSFVERVNGHKALVLGMMTYPFGLGIGSQTTTIGQGAEEARVSQNGSYILESDSSFAAVALSLGGVGLLLITILIFRLIMSTLTTPVESESDGEAIKLLCVVLVTELLFENVVNGPGGFISWTVVAFWLAHSRKTLLNITNPALADSAAAVRVNT